MSYEYLQNIGSSSSNSKIIEVSDHINLYNCKFLLKEHEYTDTFDFKVDGNNLIVTRTDINAGWAYDHNINITYDETKNISTNDMSYNFIQKIGSSMTNIKAIEIYNKFKQQK